MPFVKSSSPIKLAVSESKVLKVYATLGRLGVPLQLGAPVGLRFMAWRHLWSVIKRVKINRVLFRKAPSI